MKKKTYWQRRSEDRLLDLLAESDSVVLKLGRYYDKASKDIDKSIKSLYGRFMSDNGLDKNKALELIKGQEFKEWRMTMREYLDQIEATGDKALLLELNTLAMRSRINRLEALQAEIMANSAIIASKEEEVIGSFLSDSIEDTYYKNVYDEYKDRNSEVLDLMDKHKVAISRNQVKKVLELPRSGNNYSKNIWNSSYFIAKKAQALVARNVISGRSIESLSRDFAKVYGKQYYSNAKRLIRTETAYVKGQADVLTYEKLGVEEYELLATLDNRTSSICQEKDGKHFPVDDIQVGINYPPFHPNCRTTTIKYREDYGDRTRMAKDKDGKNVKVPLNMKYEEWKRWVKGADEGYNENEEISDKTLDDNGKIDVRTANKASNIVYKVADENVEKWLLKQSDKNWKDLLASEQNAIYEYSGTYYGITNRYLRNALLPDDDVEWACTPQMVKEIDRALSRNTLGDDLILYRGVSFDEFASWVDNAVIDTYKSSSISERAFDIFGDEYKIIIHAPKSTKGYYIGNHSEFKDEKEFLIHRGQKYKILSNENGALEVEIYE